MGLQAQYALEELATNLNDLDDRLPVGRSRCFDIGTWGGCGSSCAAFVDGECEEPQEIDYIYMVEDHGEEGAAEIKSRYPEGIWYESGSGNLLMHDLAEQFEESL